MNSLVNSTTGCIHIACAVVALIAGSVVLLSNKGTSRHKQMGLFYVLSMTFLNAATFTAYLQTDKIKISHGFIFLSSFMLMLGLYPVLIRKGKNYLERHAAFTYWSVVFLYCMAAIEIVDRTSYLVSILTPLHAPVVTIFVLALAGMLYVLCLRVWRIQFREHRYKSSYLRKNNTHPE